MNKYYVIPATRLNAIYKRYSTPDKPDVPFKTEDYTLRIKEISKLRHYWNRAVVWLISKFKPVKPIPVSLVAVRAHEFSSLRSVTSNNP